MSYGAFGLIVLSLATAAQALSKHTDEHSWQAFSKDLAAHCASPNPVTRKPLAKRLAESEGLQRALRAQYRARLQGTVGPEAVPMMICEQRLFHSVAEIRHWEHGRLAALLD